MYIHGIHGYIHMTTINSDTYIISIHLSPSLSQSFIACIIFFGVIIMVLFLPLVLAVIGCGVIGRAYVPLQSGWRTVLRMPLVPFFKSFLPID